MTQYRLQGEDVQPDSVLAGCAGMLESAVGGAICVELATLPNFTYPADIFPSSYFYDNDVGKPEIVLSGRGEVATSRVPGIAQEPDPDLLAQWTVDRASFRAK